MFEHGLVASARHAEEEMVNYLLGLEIEGSAVANKIDQLLKMALSEEGRLFLVKFLQKRSRLFFVSRMEWKRWKSLAWRAFIKLRYWH